MKKENDECMVNEEVLKEENAKLKNGSQLELMTCQSQKKMETEKMNQMMITNAQDKIAMSAITFELSNCTQQKLLALEEVDKCITSNNLSDTFNNEMTSKLNIC